MTDLLNFRLDLKSSTQGTPFGVSAAALTLNISNAENVQKLILNAVTSANPQAKLSSGPPNGTAGVLGLQKQNIRRGRGPVVGFCRPERSYGTAQATTM